VDIQDAVALEPEIMRIIELSRQDQPNSRKLTPEEEEFYGAPDEPLTDNNPYLGIDGFEGQNALPEYLKTLESGELMLILSLLLTGRDLAEIDIEDEDQNEDEVEDIFKQYYESVPEEKKTLIEYILEDEPHLEKYLTNGLMYCM